MNDLLSLIVAGSMFTVPVATTLQGSTNNVEWIEVLCQPVSIPPERELAIFPSGKSVWVDKVLPLTSHLKPHVKYLCNMDGYRYLRVVKTEAP